MRQELAVAQKGNTVGISCLERSDTTNGLVAIAMKNTAMRPQKISNFSKFC